VAAQPARKAAAATLQDGCHSTSKRRAAPVNKTSWRDYIKVHPATDLLPLMSDEELKELGEDIKKNGLQEKAICYNRAKYRWDGSPPPPPEYVLVDGRNRLDALERVGIKLALPTGGLSANDPHIEVVHHRFEEDERAVLSYVISANIHRRHLTTEQKRMTPAQAKQAAEAIATQLNDACAKAAGLEEEDEEWTEKDNKIGQQNLDTLFRMNCAAALQVITQGYTGPINERVVAAARRTADAWVKLADDLEPVISPAETASPSDDADQIEELTSEQQDQILHLMLRLLCTVDHKHRKKFYKHLTDNSAGGVYLPSCSNRGWASGCYAVDATFLDRVVKGNIQIACHLDGGEGDAAPEEDAPVESDTSTVGSDDAKEAPTAAESEPTACTKLPPLTRETIDAWLAESGQTRVPDESPDPEVVLKMRGLGFRVRRSGNEYNLTHDDGSGFGGTGIDAVNEQLDIIEFKVPVQYSTACGIPMFKINVPEEPAIPEFLHGAWTGRWANSRPIERTYLPADTEGMAKKPEAMWLGGRSAGTKGRSATPFLRIP
jgi:hypothetical protein